VLTELQIKGFKSFGAPAQTLALAPLNFVVGANASGKTNLISALRFLQNSVLQDTEVAAAEFGGPAEICSQIFLEERPGDPFMIGLKVDASEYERRVRLNGQDVRALRFHYVVQFDFSSHSGRLEIASEELTADIEAEDGKTLQHQLRRDKQQGGIFKVVMGAETQLQSFTISEREATRLALGVGGFFSDPSMVLREFIANWRFYDINPSLARMPFKETLSTALGPAGENLAVVLRKLEQEDKETLTSIIAGLQGVVPGFEGISTLQIPVEGKWAFQVLEEKLRGALNPVSVSDGTIRLLALMVIANWAVKHASLIAIEEPENGIHPHLFEHVVNTLRFASESQQLIITTHSPDFLDYLEPKEVILCDKIDGITQLHRASEVEQIDIFRKHFRLGELWVQGTLGGIP